MSYHDDDRRAPPLPKPYAFVELPRSAATAPPTGHERFRHQAGTLHLTLLARSPVHVASGLLEQTRDRKYPLVKAHFRNAGRPTVPATSLKGCVRAIVEAISPSTVTSTRADRLPAQLKPGRPQDGLDPAQRIFGTLGYQGHAAFSDAALEQGETVIVPTPQLFTPRREATATYYNGDRPKGRKFYMHGTLAEGDLPLEACPPGSRFRCRLEFSNLTPGELGLLLLGLGLGEPRLWPKLGGGKPVCLGTVEVAEARLELLDLRAAYTDFDTAPAAVADLAPFLAAARTEGLVLEPQLRQLAEVLRWPREDRECPDRSY
ncbi:MAG: hypothetical protein OHK0022_08220 [Roseiflexaceae bacterium]